MKDVISEYQALLERKLDIEQKLGTLPRGYISKKRIGAKQYLYLQTRNGDTVESKYINAEELPAVTRGLALRKQNEEALSAVLKRLAALESAAALLGDGLWRKLRMLRLCSGMDRISPEEREMRISFSDAMTSVEGVPVSAQAKRDLEQWKTGSVPFLSVFEQTLSRYGFQTGE